MSGSCDQSGRSGTFTCFPQLPFELKEQIWDEAIQNRHAEPLAHYFTLAKNCQHSMIQSDKITLAHTIRWFWKKSHFGPPPHVQAPRSEIGIQNTGSLNPRDEDVHTRPPQDVWDDPSNRSGYRLDSGLWGACVASRRAMVRNWRKHHSAAWCDCDPRSSLKTCLCVSDLFPGLMQPHDYTYDTLAALQNPYQVVISRVPWSQKQWIVTRVEVDLFVCHVHDFKSLEGWELEKAAVSWAAGRCHNIALYYDPGWASDLGAAMVDRLEWDFWERIMQRNDGLGSFARQFEEMDGWGPRSLWLIDERLEPAAGVSYQELFRDRKTFKAAGQHFIQVKTEDMDRHWITKGAPDLSLSTDAGEREVQHLNPVHSFLERFQQIVMEYYELFAEDYSEFEFILKESRYQQDYVDMEPMVLACLSDETS